MARCIPKALAVVSPKPALMLLPARPEATLGPAGEAMLAADDRNRKVVLRDLITTLKTQGSTAARCVMLVAAKQAWEVVNPQTKHGGAPGCAGGGKKSVAKDPDSGSFVKVIARVTGWKRTSLYRWLSIGAGLSDAAYQQMLGTPLANRISELGVLAGLPYDQQLDVANDYAMHLDLQGRKKLKRYAAMLKKSAVDVVDAGVLDAEDESDGDDDTGVVPTTTKTITLRRDGAGDVLDLGALLLKVVVRSVNDDGVVIEYSTAHMPENAACGGDECSLREASSA